MSIHKVKKDICKSEFTNYLPDLQAGELNTINISSKPFKICVCLEKWKSIFV